MAFRTSERFCSPNADIVFVSSDHVPVRFHIHAENLRVSAGGFPPVVQGAGGLIFDEPVPLSEPAAVLERLFAFMYPMRHPDLEDMKFEEVARFAEAAEKYEVFSAMNLCRKRMRDFASTNPLEVCLYGARHNYLDIVEQTAGDSIFLPLAQVVPLLPPRMLLPWIEYKARWDDAIDVLFDFVYTDEVYRNFHQAFESNRQSRCSKWLSISGPILSKARKTRHLNPLSDIDSLFHLEEPSNDKRSFCCKNAYNAWKHTVKSEVEEIPSFTDFVVGQMHAE